MPYLAKITLYPFKSLDGVEVAQATVLPGGALEGDRTFALVDQQGAFINGKRQAKIHQIRSFFSLKERLLSVRVGETGPVSTFQVDRELDELAAWFSAFFEQPVTIQQNTAQGFPDDLVAPGPTVIGTSTLATVASWFPEIDTTTFSRRFRTNLELADAEPFWEDRLYGEADTVVRFRVGQVLIEGTNPCKRCVVPSRDPLSGAVWQGFQKTLLEKREAFLPPWANRSRFQPFYRLAVNTRVPASEAGKILRVGDEVTLL
jgi:uncharacterized protein YcbX